MEETKTGISGKGLTDNKILDQSNFKANADDKFKVNQKTKFVHNGVKNIVGKGENAGYEHFLLFPQYFKRNLDLSCQKASLCGNGFNISHPFFISCLAGLFRG